MKKKYSVKTTHVGSLPRSDITAKTLFSIESGEIKEDSDQAKDVFASATTAVIARQKEVGIDIPSDGETSKISYATYIGKRISGFGGESTPRTPPSDLEDFPEYLQKIAKSGGTPTYKRPSCTEALGPYDDTPLKLDLQRMSAGLKQAGFSTGFMNSASPGVIALFQQSFYHKSTEDYLYDIADKIKDEYQAIIESGLYLQIDAPDLALGRHLMYKDMSEDDFLKKLDLHIDVINHAIGECDSAKVRLHVCWGNYEGPHHHDIELKKILSRLTRLKIGTILLEGANPRHAHESEILFEAEKNRLLPDDWIVAPGVIDSTSNFIEHPDLVRMRLKPYINAFGSERVLASTDCGFGTFAGFGKVDENIVFQKLRSLALGSKDIEV